MIQWFLTEDRSEAYLVRAFTWISGGELTIADGSTAPVESGIATLEDVFLTLTGRSLVE
mgnify:CR=1 FL=1